MVLCIIELSRYETAFPFSPAGEYVQKTRSILLLKIVLEFLKVCIVFRLY